MGTHQKKIPLNDLRPGMFVSDVFNEKGVLLFSSNTIINGYHQIEYLRKQGITEVVVVSGAGEVVSSPSKCDENNHKDSAEQFISFQKQAKQALAVRKNTVEAVRSMMLAAKAGRFFSVGGMMRSVEGLVAQVLENPDAFIGVSEIKSYSEQLYAHSVNVSVMMIGLTSLLGYSKEKVIEAGVAGILHDIGLVKYPDVLVQKEGLHTRQEIELLKKHPAYGIEIVQRFSHDLPASVFHVIAQHHERKNGSGYPQMLRGDQIHEMAMICAITDIYDRLTNGTQQNVCLPQEALALIFQGADDEYPRGLVERFTKLLGIYPLGSFVKLESGEMGLVVKVNRNKLLSPQVAMLFDSGGKRLNSPLLRDLSKWERDSERESWKICYTLDPHKFGIKPSEVIHNQIV